jgi:hypothetical protein
MSTDKFTLRDETTMLAPGNPWDIGEKAIGVIGNGCVVEVLQDGADDRGRPWAFVATLDGHPVGWVYRELISYN